MKKKLFGRIPEMGSYQAQLIGYKLVRTESGMFTIVLAISAFGCQLRWYFVKEGRPLTREDMIKRGYLVMDSENK